MNGCARQNQIDFSSSEAFFSSLNETKIIQKENKKITSVLSSLEKSKINNKNQVIIKESFKINNNNQGIIKETLLLNLSLYEKLLEEKIGFEEYNILKIFNNATLYKLCESF